MDGLRKTISLVGDISLLIPAGLLLLEAGYKKYVLTDYDPLIIKRGKIPILLLHGKSYNQSQWIVGRYKLNQNNIGSVFSMDYDGLCTNSKYKTIEDYALLVRNKILEIKKKTGMNEIIIIGHSLGGLVASSFAENLAKDCIIVKHVITIATPCMSHH